MNFADFLDNMDISYLKSKFPVIEDGKVRYQTGFVVPRAQAEEEEEPEEEPVVEEKVTKRRTKKAVDSE